jgi:hypothetical protein
VDIDVALEVHVPGHVTHFLVAGFRHLVEKILPNAEPRKIDTLLRSQNHKVDLAASLKDLGGFRTVPGSKGEADKVSYINAYCTEKSAVYQQTRVIDNSRCDRGGRVILDGYTIGGGTEGVYYIG